MIAELSNYYTDTHSPADDFGHNFFMGWDNNEWSRFFSFAVACVQRFLKEGVKQIKSANLERKALLADVPAQFIDFCEECLMTKYPLDGERHAQKELFSNYQSYMENRGLLRFVGSTKAFSQHIQKYFEGGIDDYRTANERGWIINKSQCKVLQGTMDETEPNNKEEMPF